MMEKENSWIITNDGIDASKGMLAPSYFIENDRLLDTRPGSTLPVYDWPIHIAEKAFISEEDAHVFVRVFKEAVLRAGLTIDEQVLSKTMEQLDHVFAQKKKWDKERAEKGDTPSFLFRGRV